MNKYLKKIIYTKDSKTKLAKSLFFGSLIALSISMVTAEKSFHKMYEGRKVIISKAKYNLLSDHGQTKYVEHTDYKSIIILISLLCGTTLAYSIIKIKN